jgi:hypothetical protein
MWRDFVELLPTFESAVVTGLDPQGYPFSVRCKPVADAGRYVLTLTLPADAAIQPGPASLLVHSHSEQLWDLRSYLVRGQIKPEGDHWIFTPETYTPGGGVTGVRGYISFIRTARRNADRYLKKRNLPRPQIPWDQINAAKPK